MSPEHADWRHVPRRLARAVIEAAGKKVVQKLLGQGDFLFEEGPNNTVVKVVPASTVSPEVLAEAQKPHGSWHLVHGLNTTKFAKGQRKGMELIFRNPDTHEPTMRRKQKRPRDQRMFKWRKHPR